MLRLWGNRKLAAYIRRFAVHCIPMDYREDAIDEAWLAIAESGCREDPYRTARRCLWRIQKRIRALRRRECRELEKFPLSTS